MTIVCVQTEHAALRYDLLPSRNGQFVLADLAHLRHLAPDHRRRGFAAPAKILISEAYNSGNLTHFGAMPRTEQSNNDVNCPYAAKAREHTNPVTLSLSQSPLHCQGKTVCKHHEKKDPCRILSAQAPDWIHIQPFFPRMRKKQPSNHQNALEWLLERLGPARQRGGLGVREGIVVNPNLVHLSGEELVEVGRHDI